MMRITLRRLPVLMLAALLAGCGDDDGSSPTGPGGDDRLQVPLAVGNRWVQRVVVTEEDPSVARAGSSADTLTVWSTLVATEERHGSTYFVQADSSDSGVTRSYLRQSGNELYTEFPIAPPIDQEIVRRVVGLVEETMPWKVAQFGAPSGTEWALASVDTTLIYQGSAYDVRFDIVASSRGVAAVTVPAGSWPDAQIFRLHVSGSAGIVGFPPATQSSDQDVWYVDGVGVVKQVNVDSFDPGQGAFTIQSIGELTEFQLQTGRP